MKIFTLRESVSIGADVWAAEPTLGGLVVSPSAVADLRAQNPDAPKVKIFRGDVMAFTQSPAIIKREKDSADKRALLLIETAAGLDGDLRVLSGLRQSKVCETTGRVLWKYLPVEQGHGLVVHAYTFRKNESGKSVPDSILLEMWPGARATIRRTGRLEGLPPELTLRWEGFWKHGDVTDPRNWGLTVTSNFY